MSNIAKDLVLFAAVWIVAAVILLTARVAFGQERTALLPWRNQIEQRLRQLEGGSGPQPYQQPPPQVVPIEPLRQRLELEQLKQRLELDELRQRLEPTPPKQTLPVEPPKQTLPLVGPTVPLMPRTRPQQPLKLQRYSNWRYAIWTQSLPLSSRQQYWRVPR